MIDFPANPTVGQSFQVGNTIYKCVSINPAVWSATIATAGIPDAPVDTKLYGRKSAAWFEVTKAAIGLGNVDNTSDVNKPVSTAQSAAFIAKAGDAMTGALTLVTPVFNDWSKKAINSEWYFEQAGNAVPLGPIAGGSIGTGTRWSRQDHAHPPQSAEPPIVAGNTGQYWRGDKSWQTLNSSAVGLFNVVNGRQVFNYAGTPVSAGFGGGVAIWWASNLRLAVDATDFGDNWPIQISGTAARANGAARADGQDRCNNWGYASGDRRSPYMRLDGGEVRFFVMQTDNDNTVQSLRQVGNPGYMEVVGNNGAFSTPLAASDERIKNNILVSTIDASAAVKAMRMISFDLNGEHSVVGFSAQNLQTIDPRMVFEVVQPEDSPMHALGSVLGLNTPAVTAYLAKALQEALARIDALEARP